MKRSSFLFSLLMLFGFISFAQNYRISILDSGRNVSLRGLSVVNEKVVWCSGSNGNIARSTDGGKHFEWMTVAGYEKRDFRDIEAFDDHTAVIIGIAEPAIILKTIDGGKTWKKVFEDDTKGMFLDAMSFDKKGNGVVIGDPIEGKIYLAITKDYGSTWAKNNDAPIAEKGESFFASSGTNIVATGHSKHPYIWVSGGLISRLFFNNSSTVLALQKGRESTGANAITYCKKKAVVVGGDFSNINNSDSNCILINLKNKTIFSTPIEAPLGYKSSVIFYNHKILIACGTSGIDISKDAGLHWHNISKESFHVVQKAKNGQAIFLAGAKGRIATLVLD